MPTLNMFTVIILACSCYASLFTVCVGCPSLGECCGEVPLLGCICKPPGWDSCCTRIADPVCVTANAACAELKKLLDLPLQGAIKVADVSGLKLDVAKGLLNAALDEVNDKQTLLDRAKEALNEVEKLYRGGVDALRALGEFADVRAAYRVGPVASKCLIHITEMYFKVELSAANGGKFQCHVKGCLLGKPLDEQLFFDTRNILSIAKSLGERIVKGISEFIG